MAALMDTVEVYWLNNESITKEGPVLSANQVQATWPTMQLDCLGPNLSATVYRPCEFGEVFNLSVLLFSNLWNGADSK